MKHYKPTIFLTILFVVLIAVSLSHAADYEEAVSYWKFDEFNRNDNFNGTNIDLNRWGNYSTTPIIDSGRLKCSSGNSAWAASGVNSSPTTVNGYFDIQVDFDVRLQPTPSNNWVDTDIRIWGENYWYDVRSRLDTSGNFSYLAYTSDGGGQAWGSDSANQSQGKLRIVRDGLGLSGYRWNGADWSKFASFASPESSPMVIVLATENVADTNVSPVAYFDNFKIADESVSDAKGVNSGTVDGATSVTGPVGAGNALRFNGTSDIVQISNESNFDFERTDSFSMGLQIKTSHEGTYQRLMGKMESDSSYAGYELFMRGDGVVGAYLVNDWDSENRIWEYTEQDGLNDGQWHNIFLTYDGSSSALGLNLYVDGVEAGTIVNSGILTGSILNDLNVSIGGRTGYDSQFFDGSIDDVGIWDRALDAYEISSIYNMGIEAFENLAFGADDLTLGYTTEELSILAQLYADGKAGLDPDSMVVGDNRWTYLSGDLPGDIGGTTYNIGDSWVYDGKYYIKLGSGLEGGAVPEMPPFAPQTLLLGFAGVRLWCKSKKVKVKR